MFCITDMAASILIRGGVHHTHLLFSIGGILSVRARIYYCNITARHEYYQQNLSTFPWRLVRNMLRIIIIISHALPLLQRVGYLGFALIEAGSLTNTVFLFVLLCCCEVYKG